MPENILSEGRTTYIPAVSITRATLKHSWGRIPVATTSDPETICGEARRIGYAGKDDGDLALYRLKIKQSQRLPTITLPGLYVLDEGMFRDYE